MSQDEKLDEALKGTFPASDAFYLAPTSAASVAPRKSPLKEGRSSALPLEGIGERAAGSSGFQALAQPRLL